jgi:hypothetical protein
MLILCNYIIVLLILLFYLKKHIEIYIICILKSNVYFNTKVNNFKILIILQNIDKLIDKI